MTPLYMRHTLTSWLPGWVLTKLIILLHAPRCAQDDEMMFVSWCNLTFTDRQTPSGIRRPALLITPSLSSADCPFYTPTRCGCRPGFQLPFPHIFLHKQSNDCGVCSTNESCSSPSRPLRRNRFTRFESKFSSDITR